MAPHCQLQTCPPQTTTQSSRNRLPLSLRPIARDRKVVSEIFTSPSPLTSASADVVPFAFNTFVLSAESTLLSPVTPQKSRWKYFFVSKLPFRVASNACRICAEVALRKPGWRKQLTYPLEMSQLRSPLLFLESFVSNRQSGRATGARCC